MTTLAADALPGVAPLGWRERLQGRLPGGLLTTVLVLLLALDAGAMPFHFIRVAVYDQIGNVEKILNGLLLVVTVIPVLLYARFPRGTTIFFAGLLAYGLTLTVLREHELGRPLIGQLYHWTIMTCGFALGYSSRIDEAGLLRLLRRMSWIITIVSAIGYLALERFRVSTGTSLYVGYQGAQMILPITLFLLQRAWVGAGVSIWVLIGSAKRGPLVSLIVAGAFVLAFRRFRNVATAIVLVGLSAGVVGWAAITELRTVVEAQTLDPESVVMRVATKWVRTAEAGDDITRATSGRDVELRAAAPLVSTTSTFLFGQGFGWWWDNFGEAQHYVHVSYMNYLVTYGVFGLLAVLGFLAIRLARLARLARSSPGGSLAWVLLLFLITNALNAATAAVLAVSLLFWVMVGVSERVVEMHEPARRASARAAAARRAAEREAERAERAREAAGGAAPTTP